MLARVGLLHRGDERLGRKQPRQPDRLGQRQRPRRPRRQLLVALEHILLNSFWGGRAGGAWVGQWGVLAGAVGIHRALLEKGW